MKHFNKRKILISFLKRVLNFVLIFQLLVYPVNGMATPQTSIQERSTGVAEQFNQDVESLRDLMFGDRRPEGYHKTHPLDTFSLLGQGVGQPEVSKDDLRWFSRFRRSTEGQAVQELSAEQQTGETQELSAEQQIEETQELSERQRRRQERRAEREKESQEKTEKNRQALIEKRKQQRKIQLENLIVEVHTDEISAETNTDQESQENSNKLTGESLSVLVHPETDRGLVRNLFSEAYSNLNIGSTFINETGGKVSFRFFHHGEMVNTFPQNVEWMTFFGDHLVFLEKQRVGSSKAFISFIDLRYFEKAVGKTVLPVFQIPVDYKKAQVTAEQLLNPESLSMAQEQVEALEDSSKTRKELVLSIGGLKLSTSQFSFLSSMQQLMFNTTVTLLDPKNTELGETYLRQIIDHSLTGLNSQSIGMPQGNNIQQTLTQGTRDMMLGVLEQRREVGSAKNTSGAYGQWNNTSVQLVSSDLATQFKDHLVQDKGFQESVNQVSAIIHRKRSFWNRYFAFLNYLSTPQPLAAPKITKSLALIANSVNRGNEDSRFETFKESIKQFLYPKKNKILLTSAIVAGVGAFYPEVYASVIHGTVSMIADKFGEILNLYSATGQTSFSWMVDPVDKMNTSYWEGSKKWSFGEGLATLIGIAIGALGFLNYTINVYALIKHLKSQDVEEHQMSIRERFISYERDQRKQFFVDLTNAERRKLGIKSGIQYGQTTTHLVFRTTGNVQQLYSALDEAQNPLTLKLNLKKGQNVIVIELTQKINHSAGEKLTENEIRLSINESSAVFEAAPEYNLKGFFDSQTKKLFLLSDISMGLEGKNINETVERLHIEGFFLSAEFEPEENERVEQVLKAIAEERKKKFSILKFFKRQKEASTIKVDSLFAAIMELSVGVSSWSNTFQSLGLFWNKTLIGRHVLTRFITVLPKVGFYAKYYNISLDHIPSVFNGGRENRLQRGVTQVQNGFKELKSFEEQALRLERLILKEVKAHAYVILLQEEARSSSSSDIVSSGIHLKPRDIQNGRLKTFYSLYYKDLFQKSIKKYFGNLVSNDHELSSSRIKKQALEKFINDSDFLESLKPSKEEIRSLVESVSRDQKLVEKARSSTDSLISGFLKRVNLFLENSAQNNLNHETSPQMARAEDADRLLRDSESLARISRQQAAVFIYDKPIELFYAFVFLAGVDYGVLKALHDQPFTEEAWFHLGRLSIWGIFFRNFVLDLLGGAWLKAQMDARLEKTQGFENVPSKEEVREGSLRWLKKQFFAEDQTWWANHKHYLKLAWANFLPSLILYGIIHAIFLGRFDIDLIAGMYVTLLVTPHEGLKLKIENTFEKFAQFAYRDLIEKGLDLKGEDKKFLSHLEVQEFYMAESSELRKIFNLWVALLYRNPAERIIDIFSTIEDYGIVKAFTPGGILPTQHWVNFIDYLESNRLVSSNVGEACKAIFTNNRLDLTGE